MGKRVIVIIEILILIVKIGVSQGQSQGGIKVYYGFKEPVPQAPDAAALFSAERMQRDLFTGAVGLNIPLVTLNAGAFSINLRLNYKSNGIKVSQLESSVGLGWVLSGLPRLSIEVRDVPDSLSRLADRDIPKVWYLDKFVQEYLLKVLKPNGHVGILHDEQPDIYRYSLLGDRGEYIYNRNGYPETIPQDNIIVIRGRRGEVLLIRGDKVYRFGGYGVIKQSRECDYPEGEIGMNSNSTVEKYPMEIESYNGDRVIFKYKRYSFRVESYTQSFIYPVLISECHKGEREIRCEDIERYNKCKVVSTYDLRYVSKIESKNGSIEFYYRDDLNNRKQPFLEKILLRDKNDRLIEEIDLEYEVYRDRVFLKRVKKEDKITGDKEEYLFKYERPEDIPEITSFSRDYWGYYNGKQNSSLIPKDYVPYKFWGEYNFGDREVDTSYEQIGILKGVKLPTGGEIRFLYEPNMYTSKETVPVYDTLREGVDIISASAGREIVEYFKNCCRGYVKLDYKIEAKDMDNLRMWVYLIDELTNETVYKDSIINSGTGPGPGPGPILMKGESSLWKFEGKLPQGRYKLEFKVIDNKINISNPAHLSYILVYPKTDTIEEVKEVAGGLRIKKIIKYSTDGKEKYEESYYYNDYNKRDKVYVVLNHTPRFRSLIESYIDCNSNDLHLDIHSYKPCRYIRVSSTDGSSTGGLSVYYPKVTISYGKDFREGGEEIRFDSYTDKPSTYECCKQGYSFSYQGPVTDMSWKRGHIIYKSYFKVRDGERVLLSTEENEYKSSDILSDTIYGAQISYTQTPATIFKLTDSVTIPYNIRRVTWGSYIDSEVSAVPFIFEDKGGQINKINRLTRYNNIYRGLVKYNNDYGLEVPQRHEAVLARKGEKIGYPAYFNGYDVWVYKDISQWIYLDRQIIKRYDENGQNPIVDTVRFYYEPQDRNLVSKIYRDSKGDIIKEEYKYPIDLIDNKAFVKAIRLRAYFKDLLLNYSEDIVSMMRSRLNSYFANETELYKTLVLLEAIGQTDRAVAAEKQVNGNIIDARYAQLKLYSCVEPQLSEMYRLKRGETGFKGFGFADGEPLWSGEDFYKTVIVDRVDKHNNVIEFHNAGGVHTVFLYGYDYSLPIAKIENARYEEVEQALSELGYSIDQLQGMGEEELISLFNRLRAKLFYSQITSYTYNPLLGVSSITNQNGYTTYYEYDGFGRLITVKDEKGNIIKSYKYHFAKSGE